MANIICMNWLPSWYNQITEVIDSLMVNNLSWLIIWLMIGLYYSNMLFPICTDVPDIFAIAVNSQPDLAIKRGRKIG